MDNLEQRFKVPPSGGLRGAVIVEDEELPRLSLKSKLETYHPDIRILGMFDNCDDALEGILRLKPQLLFLDIHLPGKNSLWLIEQLEKMMQLPLIIFTTAFTDSEYLIKAIKISAVDYLQKPVNLIELSQALEKARKILQQDLKPIQKIDSEQYTFKTYNSHLIVTNPDIVYVQADGNYTRIQLSKGKMETVFERLGEIEQKLDRSVFLRAGRSVLINKKYIRKLNSKECTCLLVVSNESYTLPLSKNAYDEIKDDFLEK